MSRAHRRQGLRNERRFDLSNTFTPKSLSSLAAWYRSDQGVTIATGVSQWNDISGNNNNLAQGTGANQPSFTASNATFSGRPTLTSTGTQWLTCTLATPTPSTIWYVGQTGISAIMVSAQAGSWYSGDTGASLTQVAGSVNFVTGPSARGGANSVVAIEGAAGQIWVSQHTGSAAVNVNAVAGTSLFALNSSANTQGGGTMAELAIWSRALTQAEIDALNTYAHNRYGITIGA